MTLIQRLICLLVLLGTSVSHAAERHYQSIAIEELSRLKRQPCVLVHVWATWCPLCVDELPKILKTLGALKKVTPVVIDFSKAWVQDSFSEKWLKALAPGFKTYRKPSGRDQEYRSAIRADWNGALPMTQLFVKGQKVKEWSGALSTKEIEEAVARLCP